MRTIAIVNHKGGCGKTTTAINLAACLAERGRQVVLLDFDPQGHATVGLTSKLSASLGICDVLLHRSSLNRVLIPVAPGLRLAPSGSGWTRVERLLRLRRARERVIRDAFEGFEDRVDFVIIDCPPTIGSLTDSALWAADMAILAVEVSFFSLHGVGRILERIQRISRHRSQSTRVRALATLYDRRTRFSREILKDMSLFFGRSLFDSVIRVCVQLREASSHGVPITRYGRRTRGYEDYMNLALEVDEDAAVSQEERSVALEPDHASGPAHW